MVTSGLSEVVEILVLDDGSRDGTAAALADGPLGKTVRLIPSRTNRGYATTFVAALRNSTTEFTLLTADDDDLLVDGIRELVAQLRTETAHVITTVYLNHGVNERGRTRLGPIRPWELRIALNHAPGIVYRVATAHKYLHFVEQRLSVGCSIAQLYPQVVLGTHVAVRHAARWSEIPTVSEGANLPSGIKDSWGRSYTAAASRLQQVLDYDDLLIELESSLEDDHQRAYARGLIGHHRRTAFGQVRYWVEREAPNLAVHMELGALRSLGLRPVRYARDRVLSRRG